MKPEEILEAIRIEVRSSIEDIASLKEMLQHQNEKQEEFNKTFRGHIEKVNTHMDVVEPYLQGAAGIRLLWKGFVAIAIGWVAIKSGFHF